MKAAEVDEATTLAAEVGRRVAQRAKGGARGAVGNVLGAVGRWCHNVADELAATADAVASGRPITPVVEPAPPAMVDPSLPSVVIEPESQEAFTVVETRPAQ